MNSCIPRSSWPYWDILVTEIVLMSGLLILSPGFVYFWVCFYWLIFFFSLVVFDGLPNTVTLTLLDNFVSCKCTWVLFWDMAVESPSFMKIAFSFVRQEKFSFYSAPPTMGQPLWGLYPVPCEWWGYAFWSVGTHTIPSMFAKVVCNYGKIYTT